VPKYLKNLNNLPNIGVYELISGSFILDSIMRQPELENAIIRPKNPIFSLKDAFFMFHKYILDSSDNKYQNVKRKMTK